jgi:hypothetical protein
VSRGNSEIYSLANSEKSLGKPTTASAPKMFANCGKTGKTRAHSLFLYPQEFRFTSIPGHISKWSIFLIKGVTSPPLKAAAEIPPEATPPVDTGLNGTMGLLEGRSN